MSIANDAGNNLFVIAWDNFTPKVPLVQAAARYYRGDAGDFPQPIQFTDSAAANLFVIAWDIFTPKNATMQARFNYYMGQGALPIPVFPTPVADIVLLDDAYGSSNVIREFPLASFGPLARNKPVVVVLELWVQPAFDGKTTLDLPAFWRIGRPDGTFYTAAATVGRGEFLLAAGTYTYYAFAANELSQPGRWSVVCTIEEFVSPVATFGVN